MQMAEAFGWALSIPVLLVVYAYVLFPAALGLLLRLRHRVMPAPANDDSVEPTVTVIVPAYNEKRSLPARIANLFESEYRRDRLDVIVVSDASTDGTTELARAYEAAGDVRAIVQERRRGKSAGLNRAVAIARGEILVFTDANAMFTRATIGALVDCFRDPDVGLATGYTRYTAAANGTLTEATGLYTRLERAIKAAEGRWGCCVGADGAVFAMRRALYEHLCDDDINDFVLPLRVVERGFKCVFADAAVCSEAPGRSIESEFGRQSRITNRTLRAIARHPGVLNPLRFPRFSFFLWSHKLARFLVPVSLALAIAAAAALVPAVRVALATVAGAAFAILLRGRAPIAPRIATPAPVRVAQMFVAMNAAMLQGWWKFLTGSTDITWQHDRSTGAAA